MRAFEQRLEAAAVDSLAIDVEDVAGWLPAHGKLVSHTRAQARDLLLQRLAAAVRRFVAPDDLYQFVDRHGFGRAQRERGEETPLLGTFELDGAARDHDFERPEQPDLDTGAHDLTRTVTGARHRLESPVSGSLALEVDADDRVLGVQPHEDLVAPEHPVVVEDAFALTLDGLDHRSDALLISKASDGSS